MYFLSTFRITQSVRTFLLLAVLLVAGNISGAQVSSTGSRITATDAQQLLDHHNEVRKEVGVGPMKWDPALAAYAQRWADYLATSNKCRIQHRGASQKEGASYGENIFWGSAAEEYSSLDASLSWYSEKEQFKYARLNEYNAHPVGHYTQMVWRTTTMMGAGMAVCPSGALIVVANYNPPGNYLGEYPF